MRLHRLEITAFGPFAGTVAVDFDDLGATGLFLLTGPTGAGKSSVLDAVCFALYGEVPGDRQQARHLRSDHAADGVAPEVVLTTSIAGRTFRFTRSPAWERPKRRGTGTTRQQPRALVEEQVGGDWAGLATRLDDVGLLVGSLLGMTCAQFTQVALLPQGRFQAFLRASSAERHDVLQRLFRTDRFERVEHWLVEHRSEVRRRSEALGLRVAGHVHRLQEAGDVTVPDDWNLDDLAGPATRGEIGAWVAGVVDGAEQAHDAALSAHRSAATAAAEAEADHAAARTVHALRAEAEAAGDTLAALAADAAQSEEDARLLALHERAMGVAPSARAAADVEAAAAAAGVAVARATADLALAPAGAPGWSPEHDPTETIARLQDQVEAAESEQVLLRAALPRATELARHRTALAALERTLAADRTGAAQARSALAGLPQQLRQVEEDQRAAAVAATDADAADAALKRARAGVAAAREVRRTDRQVEEGRSALLAATEEAQRLREVYLDAREARIASIASELAVELASGCSCPVCGSLEHPAPARSHGTATREVEDAARRSYEDAETARMALHETQAARVARLAALRDATDGLSVDEWLALVQEAEDRTAMARAAAEEGSLLTARRETLARELEEATSAVAVLDLAVARGEERVDQLRRHVATLTAELADHGTGADDIGSALVRVEERLAVLRRAGTALERLVVQRDAARLARARAEEVCGAAGFADPEAALGALLDAETVRSTTARLADRAARARAAHTTLSRPEVASALATPVPDVHLLAAAAEQATAARDAATATLLDRVRARDRTARLAADTAAALDEWCPVREAAALASSLASFVEGKGADNPLRMRLSAYVLAERLRQVVAAANERLGAMSGRRYSLEQADERGAGDRRGGLSLRVRDEWTGALRDPVTLSGGETFVVSLALALGLADTVSHEAGGTDIDTLFIDEGFGSLDAETLEEVMDTLDALREGGRTVGLVSHVPELRERITTRLEVRKTRAGSTLVTP